MHDRTIVVSWEFPGASMHLSDDSIEGKMRWSVTYVLLSLSVPDVLLWVRALHIILPGPPYACSDTLWPDARTERA